MSFCAVRQVTIRHIGNQRISLVPCVRVSPIFRKFVVLLSSSSESCARKHTSAMKLGAFINTILRSEQTLSCKPPSPMIAFQVLPVLLQCSLLHPKFSRSIWFHRLRFWLTPINVYYSIKMPIMYCFLPITHNGFWNMWLGCTGFHLVMKSLEWGLTEGYWAGRYWEKDKSDPSTPATSSPVSIGWKEISIWTIRQFCS